MYMMDGILTPSFGTVYGEYLDANVDVYSKGFINPTSHHEHAQSGAYHDGVDWDRLHSLDDVVDPRLLC